MIMKSDLDIALEQVLRHSDPYTAYRTMSIAYKILIEQEARRLDMDVESFLAMKLREG